MEKYQRQKKLRVRSAQERAYHRACAVHAERALLDMTHHGVTKIHDDILLTQLSTKLFARPRPTDLDTSNPLNSLAIRTLSNLMTPFTYIDERYRYPEYGAAPVSTNIPSLKAVLNQETTSLHLPPVVVQPRPSHHVNSTTSVFPHSSLDHIHRPTAYIPQSNHITLKKWIFIHND